MLKVNCENKQTSELSRFISFNLILFASNKTGVFVKPLNSFSICWSVLNIYAQGYRRVKVAL